MSMKTQQGEFCWNELMTSDVSKAKEFYTNLLGWTCQDHSMKDMTYTMFTKGEKTVGGMLQVPDHLKGQVPSHWMSYIFVENLDEMLQKAEGLGAQVIVPSTPVEGFGRFGMVADPTGARIAFWESLESYSS